MEEGSHNSANGQLKPYGRVSDVVKQYGLKPGMVYLLAKEGQIRSITLRKNGGRCRLLLIDMESVRAFIETSANQPGTEVQNG